MEENFKNKVSGVIVPMITPVNYNYSIDEISTQKILDGFINNGVHPFLLGTTGESMSIPDSAKEYLVKITVEYVNKKVNVYVGISSNSLRDALSKAEKYALIGVDYVVAHLPWYYPISEKAIVEWFTNLADNSPVPLILYNNPYTTHISLPVNIVKELSYHNNIYGIKDSERGVERLIESLNLFRNRNDFSFLLGWAAQSAFAVLNGADGIVPSMGNLVPHLYRNLYDYAISNNMDEAYYYQGLTDELSKICQKNKNLSESLAALKIMLYTLNLCKPYVLPPLQRLDVEEEKHIIKKTKEWFEKIKV